MKQRHESKRQQLKKINKLVNRNASEASSTARAKAAKAMRNAPKPITTSRAPLLPGETAS